ncbi:tetratricopeptide repeat protein [Hydrogenophaga sp. RWCD_12]|uniref:O-linked N-acetylglucosamine transferase family protein n=1 Tax=Hydrogenophaga sp. RWCD_12 TaxID=3391190 RepID=UPI003984915F
MSSPSDPAQATAQTRPRVTISGQLTRTGAQPVATPVASPAPTRPVQTVTLAPAADPSTQALVQARRLGGQGRYHEAEQVLLRAMASDPASVPVRRYLATVFLALAKNREAHAMLKAMVQQLPDDEQLLLNYSTALFRLELMHEAHMALEDLVRRFPANTQARVNLASIHLNNLRDPNKALEVLKPVAAEASADLQFALGCVTAKLGDFGESLAHYERALAIQPAHTETLSNFLFSLHYRHPVDLDRVRELSRKHGQAVHENAVRRGLVLAPAPPRPTGRRLRVGILSADLRLHPVGHFLETVLDALRQRGVDLVAYANQAKGAFVPARIRGAFGQWRDIADETDQRVADTIAADDLDVLLDLSGHTTGNRIGVLMRRPARRQVSWLGYFGTTGLPFIDAVIADPLCVPPGEERFFTERLLKMPHTRLCLTPPAKAPDVAPEPPMATLPWITFGCFQNASKINDSVIALWRRVLDAVPASVLRLQNGRFEEEQQVLRMRERLRNAGIDLRRVFISTNLPREHYLGQYAEVDVLLDTFPYPGGTTTAEAIWMGVPTLALATPGMLGRQGEAMLENVGLGDWVAHSEDGYVAKARALADDRQAAVATLRSLRRNLRETARKSPLFDAVTFAADLERLLRTFCSS